MTKSAFVVSFCQQNKLGLKNKWTVKTILNFEDKETKALLAKFDFEFFLKQNIKDEKYDQIDIDEIYASYNNTLKQIKAKAQSNKRQVRLYAEGQVRKMFMGGFLTVIFHLNTSRGYKISDFPATGENWAYFKYWQIYQKRKITKEKIWDIIIKTGSILAISLSFLKLFELIDR